MQYMQNYERSESPLGTKVVLFLAGFATLTSFINLILWHLHDAGLIYPYRFFISQHYNAALCFTLAGVAWILTLWHFYRFALLAGIFIFLMGVISFIDQGLHIDTGINFLFKNSYPHDPNAHRGSLPPNSAWCFMTLGVALIIVGSKVNFTMRQMVIRLLGVNNVALSTISFAAYFIGVEEPPSWARFSHLEARSAFEFLLLGLTTIVYGWSFCKTYEGALPPSLPYPTTLAVLICTVLLWRSLNIQETIEFYRETQKEGEALSRTLQFQMQKNIDSIFSMAERWNMRGGTPENEFKADALNYLEPHFGFTSITWVAQKEENALTFLGKKFPLSNHTIKNTVQVSPLFDLSSKRDGFIIYTPVFSQEKFDGFIVALFDTTAFLHPQTLF
jgi:hypothetical protein